MVALIELVTRLVRREIDDRERASHDTDAGARDAAS
jgi:hypothetical protein